MERVQTAYKLIKHMYDNSDSWTTSLLCIELAHNMSNKLVGSSVKTVDVGVGPVKKRDFFGWFSNK